MLLKIIIFKKILISALLFSVSILALLGSFRYQQLPGLAQQLTASNFRLLLHFVQEGVSAGPEKLKEIALVSGVYASLITVAAYGALRNAIWGKWLFLGILITSLPFEFWEICESYSIIKISVLILTISGCLIIGLELFKQQPRKV